MTFFLFYFRKIAFRYLFIYAILVQVTADSDEDGPAFVEPIPNVTVTVGRDASLPCVVKNLGEYKVAWIHVDRQTVITMHRHVISRISRYSISVNTENTWTLHIKDVQQEDRGYYMCQINTNPVKSQVGYLQVTVSPSFVEDEATSVTSVIIRENKNLTLTCKAEGFPYPKIIWKREDGGDIVLSKNNRGPMFSGRTIHFERATRNDIGGYLCIASNGIPPTLIKRIFVNIEFSPMVLVSNQLIAGSLQSNVTLECQSEANPIATTYWLRNKRLITSNAKYSLTLTQSGYRTHTNLIINNLKMQDFGEYKCGSKNSLGEAEGTIVLYQYEMSTKSVAQETTKQTVIVNISKDSKQEPASANEKENEDEKQLENNIMTGIFYNQKRKYRNCSAANVSTGATADGAMFVIQLNKFQRINLAAGTRISVNEWAFCMSWLTDNNNTCFTCWGKRNYKEWPLLLAIRDGNNAC